MTDLDQSGPVDAADPIGPRARAFGARHAGLLTSAALAVVWLLLARIHPETTYHLAPLLVAASWGGARRWVDRAPAPPRRGLAAAAGGGTVGLVTTVELAWINALEGPVLWGSGSALTETLVLLVLGAALGFRFVTRPRGGLLFES